MISRRVSRFSHSPLIPTLSHALRERQRSEQGERGLRERSYNSLSLAASAIALTKAEWERVRVRVRW